MRVQLPFATVVLSPACTLPAAEHRCAQIKATVPQAQSQAGLLQGFHGVIATESESPFLTGSLLQRFLQLSAEMVSSKECFGAFR